MLQRLRMLDPLAGELAHVGPERQRLALDEQPAQVRPGPQGREHEQPEQQVAQVEEQAQPGALGHQEAQPAQHEDGDRSKHRCIFHCRLPSVKGHLPEGGATSTPPVPFGGMRRAILHPLCLAHLRTSGADMSSWSDQILHVATADPDTQRRGRNLIIASIGISVLGLCFVAILLATTRQAPTIITSGVAALLCIGSGYLGRVGYVSVGSYMLIWRAHPDAPDRSLHHWGVVEHTLLPCAANPPGRSAAAAVAGVGGVCALSGEHSDDTRPADGGAERRLRTRAGPDQIDAAPGGVVPDCIPQRAQRHHRHQRVLAWRGPRPRRPAGAWPRATPPSRPAWPSAPPS